MGYVSPHLPSSHNLFHPLRARMDIGTLSRRQALAEPPRCTLRLQTALSTLCRRFHPPLFERPGSSLPAPLHSPAPSPPTPYLLNPRDLHLLESSLLLPCPTRYLFRRLCLLNCDRLRSPAPANRPPPLSETHLAAASTAREQFHRFWRTHPQQHYDAASPRLSPLPRLELSPFPARKPIQQMAATF